MNSIIILGARSQIAPFMLKMLYEASYNDVTLCSRHPIDPPYSYKALALDLETTDGWEAPEGATIISFMPIWALAEHLPLLSKAKSIIAISSTSRFGKSSSSNNEERKIVRWIENGEKKIQEWTTPNGPSTTILRPTLIYDGKTDRNVTRIIHMIEKLGFLPVAAPANGKRQPIHAADVAKAVMGAIDNKDAMNRAFNIAGGEVLTYQDMVIRIFQKMGKEPKLFMMPMWFIKLAMNILSMTNFLHKLNVNAEVFVRMNEDLVFDNKEGLKVLAYTPRKFLID